RVSGSQRLGDLICYVDDALDWKRARLGDHTRKRLAVDELHRQEQKLVRCLAEIVYRYRVNVIDAARHLCFALETRNRVFIAGRHISEQLDRASAMHLSMDRAIDRTHSAFADLTNESVSAVEQPAQHRIGSRVDGHEF